MWGERKLLRTILLCLLIFTLIAAPIYAKSAELNYFKRATHSVYPHYADLTSTAIIEYKGGFVYDKNSDMWTGKVDGQNVMTDWSNCHQEERATISWTCDEFDCHVDDSFTSQHKAEADMPWWWADGGANFPDCGDGFFYSITENSIINNGINGYILSDNNGIIAQGDALPFTNPMSDVKRFDRDPHLHFTASKPFGDLDVPEFDIAGPRTTVAVNNHCDPLDDLFTDTTWDKTCANGVITETGTGIVQCDNADLLGAFSTEDKLIMDLQWDYTIEQRCQDLQDKGIFDPLCDSCAPGWIFDFASCSTAPIANLHTHCGEPSTGPADLEGPVTDPNACANRGDDFCTEDHADMEHDVRTRPYQIANTDTTFFKVRVEATTAMGSGTPADIVYVVDKSDTMNSPEDNDLLGDTRIEKASNALNGVYSYLKNFDDLNNPTRSFKVAAHFFNHANHAAARLKNVDDFSAPFFTQPDACGCTGIGEGVYGAIQKNFDIVNGVDDLDNPLSCQDGSVQKVLILATDGIENRQRELLQVYNQGDIPDDITFYTIGIGAQGSYKDQLVWIANQWGTGAGYYTEVSSYDDLQQVYEDIAQIYTGAAAVERTTVSITINPDFEFVDDDVNYPLSVQGDELTWSLPSMNVGEVIEFNVEIKPKTPLPNGVYNVIQDDLSKVVFHTGCNEQIPFDPIYTEIIDELSPTCGDGIVNHPSEACDEGPNNGGTSYCTATCLLNPSGSRCPADATYSFPVNLHVNDPDELVDSEVVSVLRAGTYNVQPIVHRGINQAQEHFSLRINGVQGPISYDPDPNEAQYTYLLENYGNMVFAAGTNTVEMVMENPVESVGIIELCLYELCGNGNLDSGEECDEGAENSWTGSCSPVCTANTCGDGQVQYIRGEFCDDGNTDNNDGCSSTCQPEYCGDLIKQTSEECDSLTGCNADCTLQPVGDPEICDDFIDNDLDGFTDGDDHDCYCVDQDNDTFWWDNR